MEKVKHWVKKPFHMALALLVVVILGIGSTMAWFTDIEAAVNWITTGKIEIETEEELDGLIKSRIGVKSTGMSEAYVRVRVDVPSVTYTYKNSAGVDVPGQAELMLADDSSAKSAAEWNAYPENASIPASVNGSLESAVWVRYGAFWYLSTTLKQGDSAEIIASVTYPGLWDTKGKKLVEPLPDGLTKDMLTIPVTSEAVQSENIDVGEAAGAEAAMRAFEMVSAGNSN